jgi:DNA-binding MarR family transcriptional regulator
MVDRSRVTPLRSPPAAKAAAPRLGSVQQLYGRPGFMLRRAHQIATAIFLDETRELAITTTQYGILVLLADRPGIDQATVAKLLGLDRSTTGMVTQKLEEAGLICRDVGSDDRRRRSLRMTAEGERVLGELKRPAERARTRLLSVFEPAERKVFLELLDKFTRMFNETTRVPLEDRPRAPAAPNGRAKRA